ncbi:PRC-barrel domain-containing protein [Bacillus solimangrovi]|uniref:PRC-barrel domain-containing protein n=1 Tax=Bacillus solimangrovi TaxID=1305675 RepID=A0A1E5LBQ9_9BACI|nr:PRC-barrel domain-containing protein [Bacillus solimangrovi]OEH91512.1 hypothetical protein BFG57_05200 [Bacillus solimangrovi]
MRTFSNIKGMPVHSQETGKKLGTVESLCITDSGQIKGVFIDVEGFFKRDRFIPMEAINAVGRDSLVVLGTSFPIAKEGLLEGQSTEDTIGKSLYSTEGNQLGLITDVYVKDNLEIISGYEVSNGFFADVTEGKQTFFNTSACSISDDAVMIKLQS